MHNLDLSRVGSKIYVAIRGCVEMRISCRLASTLDSVHTRNISIITETVFKSRESVHGPMAKMNLIHAVYNKFYYRSVASLWPSDVIWRQKSRSTLAQVMACCLTALSHYLNQC